MITSGHLANLKNLAPHTYKLADFTGIFIYILCEYSEIKKISTINVKTNYKPSNDQAYPRWLYLTIIRRQNVPREED